MRERLKRGINVPLDWSLTQILYSYDEVSKSDIVAEAVKVNKGKRVSKNYVSKKLMDEYPDKDPKSFLEPDLTDTGRRASLHVNIPLELYKEIVDVSGLSNLSISKTVAAMLNKLYDSGKEVSPLPRISSVKTIETQRVAINFPVSLMDNAMKLGGNFRETVLEALEDYVRRNLHGRNDTTGGMGE